MKKLFGITLLVLLTSSTFAATLSNTSQNASLKSECFAIKPGLNIDKVCVGDEAYVSLTKKYGKIVDIDQSALETNKNARVYLDVEDHDGNRVRIKDNELVLVGPKVCAIDFLGLNVCTNETFKSVDDGSNLIVAGFTLNVWPQSNVYILAKTVGTNDINLELPHVFASLYAKRTGIVEATGSCESTSGLKLKSTLLRCAKKDFLKQVSAQCNHLYDGKGKISLVDWKPNGTMNPLFSSSDVVTAVGVFIPVAENCEIGASARCVKSN
jgi:hypothetical protein